MTVWLLGDCLTTAGPLTDEDHDRVLLVESRAFARRHPYHPHKLTLVFSAMRHVRDRLREAGYEVVYEHCETFAEGLGRYFDAHPGDELTLARPASHGTVARLRELVTDAGGTLRVVDNPQFLVTPEAFDDWAGDAERLRHEDFYRHVRRETGYLMADGDPVGGEWNYDDENRETPPDGYEFPEPKRFEPDEITRDVSEWVRGEFSVGDGRGYDGPPYGGDWTDPEPFRWPVTHEQAREALDAFAEAHLAGFGPYQDAMLDEEWALHHSLLSSSINIGLLHPRTVVERVIEAAREDPEVPLQSVEGFVRQVIGWREFVRHVYRREMPAMATANQLGATRDLPDLYWTGDTDMACLSDVVDGVRERGYSHHIERLMILANFATMYGVEPARLNRWFHAGYVDAYHWVTTPNVVGMGTFGTDALSTKPYVASANYVNRMSDYCSGCPYYHTKSSGDGACPFNSLYWDFLAENEETLRPNGRMGLVYSHLDDKRGSELDAIRERADEVRELARQGDL